MNEMLNILVVDIVLEIGILSVICLVFDVRVD